METLTREVRWAEAIVRSACYGYLAEGFGYPLPDRRSRQAQRAMLLEQVQLANPSLESLLRRTLQAEASAHLGDLQRAHGRLFPPIESRDCPSYETAYRGRDIFQQSRLMADAAGFYRADGLEVGGKERERPDFIATELEFMGFMAQKEAYARRHLGGGRDEHCRRVQAMFLRDHLGCWGVGFGQRVAAMADHRFFRALGALLAAWLDDDMRALEVTPSEQADTPLPPPDPEAADCGPLGCDCGSGSCECPAAEAPTP
ncbi:MAG: molecular chaperone [Acidimicrobiia bacterium]